MRERNEFSARVKVEAFALAHGRCQKCGARLSTGNTNYDHIIPCGLDNSGGDSSFGNCQCVCKSCHADKTGHIDMPAIAKAKRNERHHASVKRPRTHRWGYSKTDPFKKTIHGEIVRR